MPISTPDETIDAEIDEAVTFAKAVLSDPQSLTAHIYAP